jgi:hypothetical protein
MCGRGVHRESELYEVLGRHHRIEDKRVFDSIITWSVSDIDQVMTCTNLQQDINGIIEVYVIVNTGISIMPLAREVDIQG